MCFCSQFCSKIFRIMHFSLLSSACFIACVSVVFCAPFLSQYHETDFNNTISISFSREGDVRTIDITNPGSKNTRSVDGEQSSNKQGQQDHKITSDWFRTFRSKRSDNLTIPIGTVIKQCTVPRTIALTYDDGPSESTAELLNILQRHQAKATFFINGNNGNKGQIDQNEKSASSVERAFKEGHQIASHSWSHAHMDQLPSSSRLEEMLKTEQMIGVLLGKIPTYFRPPYLECGSESGCLADMGVLGYHVISAEVDSRDWMYQPDVSSMIQEFNNAFGKVSSDGNMLLLQHDTILVSATQLTEFILQKISEKRWKAVTLAECLGQTLESAYRPFDPA